MKKDNKSTVLLALTTAAMILPGISKKVDANPLDQLTKFDFKYSLYEEGSQPKSIYQPKAVDRYSIDVAQFKFKTPLSTTSEIGFSAVNESMSGASPWYVVQGADGKAVQIMSGATIDESRNEIGASYRNFHKDSNSETTLSAGYSTENDYRSMSLGFSGAFYVNQQLTTLEYGINASKDDIDASDADQYPNRPTNKTKDRFGLVFGASHILTKNTLLGASFSYAYLDGYLSDPYKLAFVAGAPVNDNRPDWNEQFALSLMLREFFPKANAALHVDYRFYTSTWNLDSGTLDLGWHQNFGDGWQIIPSLRFYDQSKAEFYSPYYDTTRADGFYSSDYRLSDFSAKSSQLKLLKTFDKLSVNLSYEKYDSSGSNPGLVNYAFYSFGISKIF